APDRNWRKLMERENKQTRETGRTEYNATVRQLVEFVRKRDPRYKKYNEFISEQNAAKQAEAKKRAARDRAEYLASLQQYTEQEWARVDNEEEEVIETDDDEIEEEYVCIACNKNFKHEKAWNSHERSKKHLKNLWLLQRMMKDDANMSDPNNEEADKGDDEIENGVGNDIDEKDTSQDQVEDAAKVDNISVSSTSPRKSKKQKKKQRKPNWGYGNINEEDQTAPVGKTSDDELAEALASNVNITDDDNHHLTTRSAFEDDECSNPVDVSEIALPSFYGFAEVYRRRESKSGLRTTLLKESNWRNQAESTCLSGVSGSPLQWPLATLITNFAVESLSWLLRACCAEVKCDVTLFFVGKK
ncbi:3571_t:CDS:2, partial [Paraglomus occultum]